jgi:DNA-binding SARP family transcriptional activator
MPHLHLSLLGKPAVRLDEVPLTAFSTAKTEALLYYLAVTARPHSREALARLFWGDMPDANAKRNLTKALSTLRSLIGPHLLLERQSVALDLASPYQLDVADFETAAAAGTGEDPAQLRAAADLYRGDFLDGFYVKDARDFEEWAVVQRERLREALLRVLEALVELDQHQADYAAAAEHARRLLELDPWRESAHRQLMVLLARRGQHSAALAQYEKCRQILAAELGVEPMAETTALYERIRLARLAAVRPLPAEVEPFVGRAAELAQVRRMLADPGCRLLTIHGIGGAGKTRLALATARHINGAGALLFLNGVAFVPLVDVPGPGDLPAALARALEVPLSGQASPSAALMEFLHNKELLLVLDNFEHLVEGAGWLTQLLSGCAHVKLLVTSREPLRLGAEWRLNLEGLAYPASGGPQAQAESLADFEAVQMFVQAARQLLPAFALTPAAAPHVYRLCQLVAGLPLALKLAAVWLRVMPLAQIVAEVERSLDILATTLRDVPPRQRSLRAIFDCAHERLAPAEQRALAALSIFRGGFGQEAAEQVAGASLPILATLVEKSLVQAEPNGRYNLHELLRQFAAERLSEAAAEYAARQRHGAFYLGLLKAREPALLGPEQRAAVTAIGEDLDNVQLAWRWAVGQADTEAVARVIDPLFAYYQIRSRYCEGDELFGWAATGWQPSAAQPQAQAVRAKLLARWGYFSGSLQGFAAANERLQAALALSPPPAERAFALCQLGRIAVDQGDRAAGEAYLRQSLELSRAIGDQRAEARALNGLAKAAFEFGDFVPAAELARQSLALCRQVGRPDQIATALGLLAWPTNCLGGYAESAAYWQEGLALYEQLGDTLGATVTREFLGWVAWCEGGPRLPEAIAHYETALATFREFGHRQWLAMCLGDLALATTELGQPELAMRYGREGLAMAQEIGVQHLVAYTQSVTGAAAAALGDLAASRQHLMQALHTSLGQQKQDSVMNVLYFLARLLLQESEAASQAAQAQPRAQARELLVLVCQHPATWQAIRDRAGRMLAELPPAPPGFAAPDPLPDWPSLTHRLARDFATPL